MIKAVLFDLDGTLINTNKLIMQSFKHTLRTHFKRDINETEIIKFFGRPLGEAMNYFDSENAELLVKQYREYNEARHDALTEEFPGVEEALRQLKNAGIRMAVVTSKRRTLAERGLKLMGLENYMDEVITPEDTKNHKPEAEPALKACEILGVAPENALMVGDSTADILCGKNAGCKTCAVSYSVFAAEELGACEPDYTVDNLLELIDIIEEAEERAV